MNKTYCVVLDPVSRFRRPAIERFRYVPAHRRLVWREEETSDISRLAELFNEALACAERMPFANLRMRVIEGVQDSSAAPEATAIEAPPIPTISAPVPQPTQPTGEHPGFPPAENDDSPGARRRARRRLLQHA